MRLFTVKWICFFLFYPITIVAQTDSLNVSQTTAPCAGGSCDDSVSSGFLFPCEDTAEKWDGITYVVSQNDTVYWGPCGFPNPFRNPQLCGPYVDAALTHVCDPDDVLNGTREELDDFTASLTEEMPTVRCKRPKESVTKEKVHLVVALVQRMRTVDMNQSICQDNCGQVLPYMTPAVREPTEAEVTLSAQAFAQVLQATWQLGSCGNDIVVFFVADYGVITGSYGEKAADKIDKATFKGILASGQQMYGEDGDALKALKHVVNNIEKKYGASPLTHGSGPAYILLAVLGVLAVLFLVGFGCTYHYGRVSDYWDEQWWEVVIKYILYVLFGVFIIEWIVYGLVVIENKVRVWWLVVPALGVILSVLAIGILVMATNGN